MGTDNRRIVFKNRLIEIRKRETPNEFTELADAVSVFSAELDKIFRPICTKILEWLTT